MARRTKETKDNLVYKDKHCGGHIQILNLVGGIIIQSKPYHSCYLNPNQTRYIAKKLIQFADDIDKEISNGK